MHVAYRVLMLDAYIHDARAVDCHIVRCRVHLVIFFSGSPCKLVILMLLWMCIMLAQTDALRGLPGISKDAKDLHKSNMDQSMRLFKMRNIMTAWYCNDAETTTTLDICSPYDLSSSPSPARPISSEQRKQQMSKVYKEFCQRSVTTTRKKSTQRTQICTDALLRKTYGTTAEEDANT